jgi:ketopantoate reductase
VLLPHLQLAYYRHREKLWALSGTLSLSIEAYYEELLRREGEASGLGPSSSVLFIGAGATPYTAVALAREFGCRVTAVDRDRLAVLMAKRYLAQKAPGLPVVARYGAGESIAVSDFDVVMLALHAAPKHRILEHLGAHIPRNARVVVRNPWGPWCDLYEPMPANLSDVSLSVESVIPHSGTYRFDSVVLQKA